jgi:hypothetical protein
VAAGAGGGVWSASLQGGVTVRFHAAFALVVVGRLGVSGHEGQVDVSLRSVYPVGADRL